MKHQLFLQCMRVLDERTKTNKEVSPMAQSLLDGFQWKSIADITNCASELSVSCDNAKHILDQMMSHIDTNLSKLYTDIDSDAINSQEVDHRPKTATEIIEEVSKLSSTLTELEGRQPACGWDGWDHFGGNNWWGPPDKNGLRDIWSFPSFTGDKRWCIHSPFTLHPLYWMYPVPPDNSDKN